jgi:hypothetical protein
VRVDDLSLGQVEVIVVQQEVKGCTIRGIGALSLALNTPRKRIDLIEPAKWTPHLFGRRPTYNCRFRKLWPGNSGNSGQVISLLI